jgi:hypothetical protein
VGKPGSASVKNDLGCDLADLDPARRRPAGGERSGEADSVRALGVGFASAQPELKAAQPLPSCRLNERSTMNPPAAHSVRLAGSTIQPPCHACAFFHSEDEEYDLLLPFIKEGFAHGDKSFHIIDERRRSELMDRLTGAGIAASQAEASGQLEVRGWEDAHLRPGWFDQHAMLALVEEVLTTAERQGFKHTRWIADMGWALEEKEGVEDLVEYCARLNHVVPRYRATVICTYDLARFSAAQVVDVLRSHPLAVIGGIVQENPFYVAPEQLIREVQQPRQGPALS